MSAEFAVFPNQRAAWRSGMQLELPFRMLMPQGDPRTYQIIGAAMEVHSKGQRLTGFYRIDFVCFDGVVVEVKAVSAVGPAEDAQILNYLALTRIALGCCYTSAPDRCFTSGSFWMLTERVRARRLDTELIKINLRLIGV